MEVLAHGVFHNHFVNDTNRGEWWVVLKEMEKDIRHGINNISTDQEAQSDIELHELLVHIVTKFFLELTNPELPADTTLETVQLNALEWFMARA
jgi:hypothetical protein